MFEWKDCLGRVALVCFVATGSGLFAPGMASGDAPGDEVVEEILQVLANRGILSERDHIRLVSRVRADQDKRRDVAARMLEGFEWSGDLRLRYEAFYYDEDAFGSDRDNRYRFRYRARFGFKKKVNDWVTVSLRLASGMDDPRSTNRTLGDDEDFDPDDIFIDRAFAEITLPELDGGLETKLVAGKLPNPYVWKAGKDFLIWDHDINPEGAFITASYRPDDQTRLWGTFGGFIVDENSTSSDPKVFGLQIGGQRQFGEDMELGLRASGYEWRSLDGRFIRNITAPTNPDDSATEFGNLASAFDTKARIGEISGFATLNASESWPLTLYGTVIRNFSADSATILGVPIDEEDSAWGAGIEIGSSRKLAKLGLGYFYVEANAVVAQFMDSNLFDGYTNREGFVLYAARRLGERSELKLTLFDGEEIKTTESGGGAGPFVDSIPNGDRKRLQTDLVFKF